MKSLRQQALEVVLQSDAHQKATLAGQLDDSARVDSDASLREPAGLPGRPARPVLFAKLQSARNKPRPLTTVEGRAELIHALAHIELNAIDLAADVVWRFAGLPDEFYRQWAEVAKEEACHFQLLRDHLHLLGYDYGDFPAHTGLWDMAEKTKHDLLARLALVPRTLEARGLDASPAVKNKLTSAGDLRAGQILDIILRDEIGHVRVGNHWYRHLCEQRRLDPISTGEKLAAEHGAPRLQSPFNLEARRAAGFGDEELAMLARP
ncbi:MAG: ferritin-like domain-containing protein [Burkholderiaceae bacterium]|nr:ferritin-like domain-containing protein [Burkholderiaceae bacterium]